MDEAQKDPSSVADATMTPATANAIEPMQMSWPIRCPR